VADVRTKPHYSIKLNMKIAIKITVIPDSCRNSDTFNYKEVNVS